MPILKERNLVNQKKKNVWVIWSKHFCTIFSLIFSPIGEIEFWWGRRENSWTLPLFFPFPIPSQPTKTFTHFLSYFSPFSFSFSILSTIIQPNIFAPYKRRPHDLLDRCGIFLFPEEIYWFWFSYRLNWPMVIGLGFGWTKKEESVFFSKQNMGLDFLSPEKSNGWRGFIFCSNGIMG